MGAALAYYTLFALAPMLLVALWVAGLFYNPDTVRGELVTQIDGLVGTSGAELIEGMLRATAESKASLFAKIVGAVTFFLGCTGAFLQMQRALNDIWKVQDGPGGGVKGFALDRLRSFGMVLSIGFLLLVSLVVSTALAAMAGWAGRTFGNIPEFWLVVNQVVSVAVITLLFAMMFRFLPDVDLRWRDVWTGALITAVLFTVGKFLIGLYLGRSSPASAYGAAGSVVVLLLWVFYSAQIVLFGAEITRVMARQKRMEPRVSPQSAMPEVDSDRPA